MAQNEFGWWYVENGGIAIGVLGNGSGAEDARAQREVLVAILDTGLDMGDATVATDRMSEDAYGIQTNAKEFTMNTIFYSESEELTALIDKLSEEGSYVVVSAGNAVADVSHYG